MPSTVVTAYFPNNNQNRDRITSQPLDETFSRLSISRRSAEEAWKNDAAAVVVVTDEF
jgi:hypothetical protein